jgi:hypothetical protein
VVADDEISAFGTTSTPSGARRSIPVSVPSPEGGAAGERRGKPAGRAWAERPGPGLGMQPRKRRCFQAGLGGPAGGGTVPDEPFRSAGWHDGEVLRWKRLEAGASGPRRTGEPRERNSDLSRMRGYGRKVLVPPRRELVWRFLQSVNRERSGSPDAATRGRKLPRRQVSCPARTRLRRISVQRAWRLFYFQQSACQHFSLSAGFVLTG